MKRILFVNILILLVFAGISYWAQEKEKLELTMAERAQTASAAGTEEETPQPAGTTQKPAKQNPQAENQTDAQQEETKKDLSLIHISEPTRH